METKQTRVAPGKKIRLILEIKGTFEKVLADQNRFFQSNVSFRFCIILSSTPGVKNRFHVMWAEPVWGVISGSTDREERRIKNREHDMTRPLR